MFQDANDLWVIPFDWRTLNIWDLSFFMKLLSLDNYWNNDKS